jgi:SAM-dependent methyltransferase
MTDNADLGSPQQEGPREGDAFGVMLMECLDREAVPGAILEIVERDDGYIDGGDAARYFTPPARFETLDRWVCDRARGRVLDIGSGAGRHALYLQEQGHEVVALDVSPLASEVCRRRGVREIFTGTVLDLARAADERFDAFILMGNNLGLLESAEHAPTLLAALAELSQPDAIVLGVGTDPYLTTNPLHLRYHQRNRERDRMPGQVRIRVRFRDLASPWFDYLFVSLPELNQILARSSWVLEDQLVEGPHYAVQLKRT